MENKKYFIALTGRKKNVGDFLITNRAINLLETISPEYDYIIEPHWEEINDINYINNSEGIIILGGPGFQINMYPGIYKLVKNLKDIKVPIHTLGVGWNGSPGDRTTEKLFRFNDTSKTLLKKMNETDMGMSCRDYQTLRVLKNNKYKNVTMTGCPVWYDINSLGKKFFAPKKIKKVVYTPAQKEIYSNQSVKVLEYIKSKYKNAEIIVSFHRGIGDVDKYTTENDARNTLKLATIAKEMGVQVVDTSYDEKKLNFYDECDLHIGYRVHAHIYFLSKRLPSILLHEDGRGNGVSDALGSPGINAYKTSKILSKVFSIFNKNILALRIYRKLAMKLNNNILEDLNNKINDIEVTNYHCFYGISKYIDEHYEVMEQYIKSITNKN